VLELNASDTRNKREIEAQLSNAVTCQAISNSNVSGGSGASRKRLVIMDEVDGMGGSDRGGIAELIKVCSEIFPTPYIDSLGIAHCCRR
jgi:replication factor C subunit 1